MYEQLDAMYIVYNTVVASLSRHKINVKLRKMNNSCKGIGIIGIQSNRMTCSDDLILHINIPLHTSIIIHSSILTHIIMSTPNRRFGNFGYHYCVTAGM